jgi:hypothetical protein
MHLRRQQVETLTEPPPMQRVELWQVDGRTDLACILCQHVIAYGIKAERSPADDRFYLEQHAPFCVAGR